MTDILHTATINNRPVRFTLPPIEDDSTPWVVFEDVVDALGLSTAQSANLINGFIHDCPAICRRVEMATGPTFTVPSAAGAALVELAPRCGGADARDDFSRAEGDALDAFFGGVMPLDEAIERRVRARRWWEETLHMTGAAR